MAQASAQFEYTDEEFRRSLQGKRGVASESIVDLLVRPGETVGQLATNLSSNLEQTLDGDYGPGSGSSPQPVPGPTGDPGPQRRSAASQLNLDVYSSNPDVQRFLDVVERARSEGRTRSANATISGSEPEPSITDGLFRARLRKLLKNESPASVERYNRTYLVRMGIERNLVEDFLSHPAYSPHNHSMMVAYMRLLDDLADPGAIIQNALRARTETDALAQRYATRMLVHYDRSVAPLASVSAEAAGLIAVTNAGNSVLFSTADLVQWDAATADALEALASHDFDSIDGSVTGQSPDATVEPSVGQRSAGAELVIAGIASDEARSVFNARGLVYRELFSFK
jgi:hypothetical protein